MQINWTPESDFPSSKVPGTSSSEVPEFPSSRNFKFPSSRNFKFPNFLFLKFKYKLPERRVFSEIKSHP